MRNIIFYIVTLFCATAYASPSAYRYMQPLINEIVTIVPEEKIVINGPYGDEVYFCDKESQFICVEHPIFWLSIPKNIEILSSGETWEHLDAEYKLLAKYDNYKFKIFDTKVAYIIRGKREDGEVIYLVYTTKQGVIYRESNRDFVFNKLILDGVVGFGSID